MKLSFDNAPLAGLVSQFLSEMHRYDAGRTLRLLHEANMTTPQLAVLEFVRVPRTLSAIADHIGLSRPAASQMVSKLVRRRLVRRSEGVADRREKAIGISAKGNALLESVSAARMARFESSLAALPPRTADRLRGALAEAVAVFDESNASTAEPVASVR
ncbi:MAG TPA: MarR family winged helix-turn-helix transcriptional regulator [Terracidiphilus sp.]|nr:MarR family winged helix-turn-helix transcriptional regulator [Terracidiphilus sp.]